MNTEQILSQYEAAAKEARRRASTVAESAAESETFAGDLESRISRREVSPEAARREKETISKVFAAPEEMRARLKDTRLLPSEVGSMVGDRMNTYLSQLQSIRDSRSSRQQNIDDIVEDAASGVASQAKREAVDLDVARDTRDEYWKQYSEAQRQLEHQQNLAKAGTQTDRDRNTINSIVSEYAQFLGESNLSPDWDGGMDVDKYITLLNKAERELGANGREWFLERFSPSQAIATTDENINRLNSAGINFRDIASRMSTGQLRMQMTDDLNRAETAEDFMKVKDFYRDFTELFGTSQAATGNKALFKDYMIDTLGSEEMAMEEYYKIFPLSVGGIGLKNPVTGESLKVE